MTVSRHPLPALHPFIGRDVPWLLETRAELSGPRTFLVYCPFDAPVERLTYAEFFGSVRRCAAGLAGLGVRAGDYVLVHLGNCPEFLVSWFACSWLGAIAVTTNTASAPGELRYFADRCGARHAITEPGLLPALEQSGVPLSAVVLADPTRGAQPLPPGATAFAALLDGDAIPGRRPPDPAAFHSIMFTSGTTSRPKGVVWTHANVLWAAERNSAHMRLRDDDVALAFLPLFHANALGYSMLATLWSGGTLVLQPKLSISRFWPVALEHRCTWTSAGSFIYRALREQPPPASPHAFRFWGGGMGADPEIDPAWGIPGLGWYGMTETVSHTILSDLGFPSDDRSIGKPVAEYEQRLVDATGAPVAPGAIGRLLVRAPRGVAMFAEYLNEPEATAAAFDADGWFDTGDMLELRTDGSLVFCDRAKDMLKVGGENVAASEVETAIQAVTGVVEAAVVGRRDEFLGEVPWAFVVARPSDEAMRQRILAHCRVELARFKVPKGIEFLDALPRLPIGKIDKKPLRTWWTGGAL